MSRAKKDINSVDANVLTPREISRALLVGFKIRKPMFIWGPMGIGKSDIIRGISDSGELGNSHVIDLRMANMEPTDIRGIPYPSTDDAGNKCMRWAQPVALPSKEFAKQFDTIILFFDELNTATPSTQASTYQLVLDRKVGEYSLPDNVVMVAAGNRESDKGVTYKMPSPLANRLIHLEMTHDYESWLEWATNNHINPDIIGHISTHKQDLFNFDIKDASRAFPTPRSWTTVSKILEERDKVDFGTLKYLIDGAIGQGTGYKFAATLKAHSNLPNPTDVLEGRVLTLDSKVDISGKFSLLVSMCYELKTTFEKVKGNNDEAAHKNADHFLAYIMKNYEETELVVLAIHMALETHDIKLNSAKLKNFKEFYARFSEYIKLGNAIT